MRVPQRKLIVGTAPYFYWIAPGPPVSSNPAIVFRAGATTLLSTTLSQAVAATAVSAISADRTTLTVAAASGPARQGLVGEWLGRCALVIEEGGGWLPVTVQRFSSATAAVLAEPLPHDVTIAAGASLESLVFSRVLAAANVTAAVRRNVHWSVTYSTAHGQDAPATVTAYDGFLHVVRRPFDTGLTHAELLRRVPEFARSFPDRQEDWEPQLALALDEMEADINARLDVGRYADDLLGEQFARAHSLLVAANVLESRTGHGVDLAEPRDSYRARYEAAMETAFKRLAWLDADADGVVDTGETDITTEALPTAEYVDSYYRTADFDTTIYPRWTRDRQH